MFFAEHDKAFIERIAMKRIELQKFCDCIKEIAPS